MKQYSVHTSTTIKPNRIAIMPCSNLVEGAQLVRIYDPKFSETKSYYASFIVRDGKVEFLGNAPAGTPQKMVRDARRELNAYYSEKPTPIGYVKIASENDKFDIYLGDVKVSVEEELASYGDNVAVIVNGTIFKPGSNGYNIDFTVSVANGTVTAPSNSPLQVLSQEERAALYHELMGLVVTGYDHEVWIGSFESIGETPDISFYHVSIKPPTIDNNEIMAVIYNMGHDIVAIAHSNDGNLDISINKPEKHINESNVSHLVEKCVENMEFFE